MESMDLLWRSSRRPVSRAMGFNRRPNTSPTVLTARVPRPRERTGVRPPRCELSTYRRPQGRPLPPLSSSPMSKKTKKKKARMRRSKANHGKRPNMGRG